DFGSVFFFVGYDDIRTQFPNAIEMKFFGSADNGFGRFQPIRMYTEFCDPDDLIFQSEVDQQFRNRWYQTHNPLRRCCEADGTSALIDKSFHEKRLSRICAISDWIFNASSRAFSAKSAPDDA